jgi:hypothetical protein
MVKRELR